MEQTLRPAGARPLWLPSRIGSQRRLGSVLAAPRGFLLVYYPCLMLATGLLCWLVPNDFMLIVGALVLAVVGLYLPYSMIFAEGPFRFSTLLVFTLSFGYGAGTANTYFTLPRGGMDLAVFLRRDPVVVTHGMAGLLIALAVVLALGELLEKPVFGEDFVLLFPPQSSLFLVIATGILGVGYLTGQLGYEGSATGEQSQVSVMAAFVGWLLTPTFALTLVAGLNAPSVIGRYFLLGLNAVQFLMIVPTGRRNQVFSLLIAIFCIRLGRFRLRWSWARKLVVATLIISTLYVFTVAFFYLRLAGNGHRGNIPFSQRVSAAWHYFQTTSFAEVQEQYNTNIQRRTFVLGFLSEVQDLSYRLTPGYGRDLVAQFEQVIPSALDPGKQRGWTEEGLTNQLFGTTYWDEANSVMTAGAIDFGIFGMALYPLLFVAIFRIFAEAVGQGVPTFLACFLIVESIAQLIQPETDPSAYLVGIRNGVLFGAVVWAVLALPTFRFRSRV